MLTFKVYPDQPRQGNLKVLFLPEKGEESACEWQLQLDKARAQYGTNLTATYASSEKTLREGGAPQTASNLITQWRKTNVLYGYPFHTKSQITDSKFRTVTRSSFFERQFPYQSTILRIYQNHQQVYEP